VNIVDLCQIHDVSIEVAERSLASLQAKGLISGFVPGDRTADIVNTPKADVYVKTIAYEAGAEAKRMGIKIENSAARHLRVGSKQLDDFIAGYDGLQED
jgi:hypothetical protein